MRRKISRRHRSHAEAKKTDSSKFRTKFESLRREIKADMKKQHDLYVNNLVDDVKANPRAVYRFIDSQKRHAKYSIQTVHLSFYKEKFKFHICSEWFRYHFCLEWFSHLFCMEWLSNFCVERLIFIYVWKGLVIGGCLPPPGFLYRISTIRPTENTYLITI